MKILKFLVKSKLNRIKKAMLKQKKKNIKNKAKLKHKSQLTAKAKAYATSNSTSANAKLIVSSIVLAALATELALGYKTYRKTFVRKKVPKIGKKIKSDKPEKPFVPLKRAQRELGMQWLQTVPNIDVHINSDDGLKLHGIYIPAKEETDRTVILVHGYESSYGSMLMYAQYYRDEENFNILLPNHRSHGESEGNVMTVGNKESIDIIRWSEWILANFGTDSRIILHGESMGAATVLMASGRKLPKQVVGIVSDCAYSSFYEEMNWVFKVDYKMPPFPLVPTAMQYAKILQGCDHKNESPLNSVKNSKTPTLFVHGTIDSYVPCNMAYDLYNACTSEKTLLIIPEAEHAVCFIVAPDEYKKALNEFINKYIPK